MNILPFEEGEGKEGGEGEMWSVEREGTRLSRLQEFGCFLSEPGLLHDRMFLLPFLRP